MSDPREFRIDLGGRHDMSVREVVEVELHAGPQKKIKRRLVDRRRTRGAVVGGRMEVIGRVHMRAAVRGQRDILGGLSQRPRPKADVGQ